MNVFNYLKKNSEKEMEDVLETSNMLKQIKQKLHTKTEEDGFYKELERWIRMNIPRKRKETILNVISKVDQMRNLGIDNFVIFFSER